MGFYLLSSLAGGAAFFNGTMAARSWWLLLFFVPFTLYVAVIECGAVEQFSSFVFFF